MLGRGKNAYPGIIFYGSLKSICASCKQWLFLFILKEISTNQRYNNKVMFLTFQPYLLTKLLILFRYLGRYIKRYYFSDVTFLYFLKSNAHSQSSS